MADDQNLLNKVPKILRFKWNYFFEFLILFFAVFLGFLSENYRESIAEQKTEANQALSLVEDLKVDVATIKRDIEVIDIAILCIDSLVLYIDKIPEIDSLDLRFSTLNARALPYLRFKSVDRTSSQLKNGGLMNLIRDIKISNAISNYWKLGEVTIDQQERFNVYRLKSREAYFTMFRVYEYDLIERKLISRKKIPVDKNDLSRLKEYANYMDACRSVMKGHKWNLTNQADAAALLINDISKAYQF